MLNDAGEAKALKRVLRRPFARYEDHQHQEHDRSWTWRGGRAVGGGSIVGASRDGCVPPTINYTPDPEIDIPVVGNTAQEVDAQHAIVNAFGFGGQNVVAVFRKSS